MRVRVEMRRKAGVFIPRFRPQRGLIGELRTDRKSMHDREYTVLTVHVEPVQGFPHVAPACPELFEARITNVFDDRLCILGWEADGGAWHVQEWDCYLIPELPPRRVD